MLETIVHSLTRNTMDFCERQTLISTCFGPKWHTFQMSLTMLRDVASTALSIFALLVLQLAAWKMGPGMAPNCAQTAALCPWTKVHEITRQQNDPKKLKKRPGNKANSGRLAEEFRSKITYCEVECWEYGSTSRCNMLDVPFRSRCFLPVPATAAMQWKAVADRTELMKGAKVGRFTQREYIVPVRLKRGLKSLTHGAVKSKSWWHLIWNALDGSWIKSTQQNWFGRSAKTLGVSPAQIAVLHLASSVTVSKPWTRFSILKDLEEVRYPLPSRPIRTLKPSRNPLWEFFKGTCSKNKQAYQCISYIHLFFSKPALLKLLFSMCFFDVTLIWPI